MIYFPETNLNKFPNCSVLQCNSLEEQVIERMINVLLYKQKNKRYLLLLEFFFLIRHV